MTKLWTSCRLQAEASALRKADEMILKHSQYTFWGYFLAKVLQRSEKMEITLLRNSGENLKNMNSTGHCDISYALNVKSVVAVSVSVLGNAV